MALENLKVDRIILHEVFRRLYNGDIVPPTLSGQPAALQAEAMDAFRERVVDAMGNSSQSMEMDIAASAADSGVGIAASVLAKTTDTAFSTESQRFPTKLAGAQIAKNLPGGVVIVFTGTVGTPTRPFVGVIKAETQTGFRRQVTAGGAIGAQFINDLFLTPAAKLYKIGMFIRDGKADAPLPDAWRARIYDNQMTLGNREGAARYFYEAFLGCRFPVNSAAQTKAFFEHTRDFIAELNVPPEKRNDLLTSLYTYLKVDQSPTIQVNAFSTSYLPEDTRDDYRDFMKQKKVPLTAIQKDLAQIGGSLRLRKVNFPNSIRLQAPPEVFKEKIKIETVTQKDAKPGQPGVWTIITIKDRISDQE